MFNIASGLEKVILESKDTFFRVNIGNVASVVNNLKFVYHSIVASENLLSCAIDQLRELDNDRYNEGSSRCPRFINI